MLQVSAVRKPDGDVGRAEVMEFSQKGSGERRASEIDSVNYFGLSCTYEKDNEFWAEWWLARGSILVYITYNVKSERQDVEIGRIQRIVDSLRITET
ncbi:MAG TPA: hypothetical protein VG225_16175 [Terracidiphilus sp.]|nr:hypothetical protein [Terracidiphilus sp.]